MPPTILFVKMGFIYRLREKSLGDKHPETAKALNNLAICLHCKRKYVQAGMYLNRSIAAAVEKLGADHPTTMQYKDFLKINNEKLRQRRTTPWLQP